MELAKDREDWRGLEEAFIVAEMANPMTLTLGFIGAPVDRRSCLVALLICPLSF